MAKVTSTKGKARTTVKIKDEMDLEVVTLARAVNEFYQWARLVRGVTNRTIQNYRPCLERLIKVCTPELPAHTLTSAHFGLALKRALTGESKADTIARQIINPMAKAHSGRDPRSMNVDKSTYRLFVRFLHTHHYLSPYRNPTADLVSTRQAVIESKRLKMYSVPFERRRDILVAAGNYHPRARFICAMGLFGGRRWDDMHDMTIGDIDLDNRDGPTFTFINHKTGGERIMLPIVFPEFETEIRTWLAWYAGQLDAINNLYGERFTELDPNWYLIPRRAAAEEVSYDRCGPGITLDDNWPIAPRDMSSAKSARSDARIALETIGAPMETRMGNHTLRHSCAEWLIEVEQWPIYDVKAWLAHGSVLTTQIYTKGSEDMRRLRKRYGGGTRPPVDEVGNLVMLSKARAELRRIDVADEHIELIRVASEANDEISA